MQHTVSCLHKNTHRYILNVCFPFLDYMILEGGGQSLHCVRPNN